MQVQNNPRQLRPRRVIRRLGKLSIWMSITEGSSFDVNGWIVRSDVEQCIYPAQLLISGAHAVTPSRAVLEPLRVETTARPLASGRPSQSNQMQRALW